MQRIRELLSLEHVKKQHADWPHGGSVFVDNARTLRAICHIDNFLLALGYAYVHIVVWPLV